MSEDNPILRTEAYQLGLDAGPMAVCILLLAIVHPGFILGSGRDFPPRKELKAIKKQEKMRKKEAKWNKKHGTQGKASQGYTEEVMLETGSYRPGDSHNY